MFYFKDFCSYAASQLMLCTSSSTQKCIAGFEQTSRHLACIVYGFQDAALAIDCILAQHVRYSAALGEKRKKKQSPEYVNKLYKAITEPHAIIYSGM